MHIRNEAKEKFKTKQEELCGFLFGMLREINALEREIYARDLLINEKIPVLSAEEIKREFDAMWSDFHRSYEQIVADRCTDKLLAKSYGTSYNSRTTYGWAEEDYEGCSAVFQMSAPRKALIEVRYKLGTLDASDRFTLVKLGERWFVDAHSWWTTYDNVWHRGHI